MAPMYLRKTALGCDLKDLHHKEAKKKKEFIITSFLK
jgi:hypothetical protein